MHSKVSGEMTELAFEDDGGPESHQAALKPKECKFYTVDFRKVLAADRSVRIRTRIDNYDLSVRRFHYT